MLRKRMRNTPGLNNGRLVNAMPRNYCVKYMIHCI